MSTATAASSPLLRSLHRSHGFEPMRVEGRLPRDLVGTLYRAGPGLFERFGVQVAHPFETDGAISAVRFDGAGGAQGAARIVESAGYHEEGNAGRFLYNSSASWLDRLRAVRRGRSKSTGNTSVWLHQDRLFALMEGGLPQEMDLDTLDTLDETDFGGVIPAAFSAHPHRVASLKTTFNFGLRYGRRMEIDLFSLPDQGRPSRIGTVTAPWMSMVHDFMATERHLLLFLGPVRINVLRSIFGGGDISKMLEWKPELGSRLIVVPLDAPDKPRTFELDPFWVWHFANAFEDGSGPSVDMCRIPRFDIGDVGQIESIGSESILTRLHVDLQSGKVTESKLFDVSCEFPQVHPGVHGARHRVAFVQSERREGERSIQGVSRVDLETGTRAEWAAPEGHIPSEPVFVPRSEVEGDGWILDLLYDRQSDHSWLAVLDGQRLEEGPVATAHFDQPIPVTFHGAFQAGR